MEAIIGDAEQIRDLLFGPPQHNHHCLGWRWKMHCKDDPERWASVEAELAKMRTELRSGSNARQR